MKNQERTASAGTEPAETNLPFKEPTINLPGANKKERVTNSLAADAQTKAMQKLCAEAENIIKTLKDLLIDPSSKIRLGAATVLLGKLLPDKLSVQGDALDQLDDKDLNDLASGKKTMADILKFKDKKSAGDN